MKWNAWTGLRSAAAAISCATMLLTPLAQGAKAEELKKESLKRYLRYSGQDNPKNTLTVGEFHRKFRLWYPQPLRAQMDDWASKHRYEKMPKVDTSIIKDKDGKEQVRMLLTKDGLATTVMTGDGFVQVGSVKMTVKDYHQSGEFVDKLIKQDPYFKNLAAKSKNLKEPKVSIAVTAKEWASFSKEKRAQYLLRVSGLVRTADFIMNATPNSEFSSKKKSTSSIMSPAFEMISRWVMGEPAFCQVVPSVGMSCIVAGWVATYGQANRRVSCGGMTEGRANWEQQIQASYSTFPNQNKNSCAGSFPCNPLVYGFDTNGGAHCVPSSQIKDATQVCNGKSELNGEQDTFNAGRIVKSWLKAQGREDVQFDDQNRIRVDQFASVSAELDKLNQFIDAAVAACDRTYEGNPEDKNTITKRMPDQQRACEAIRERKAALASYLVQQNGDMCDDGKPPKKDKNGRLSCGVVVGKSDRKIPWALIAVGGGIALCVVLKCFGGGDDPKTPKPTDPVDDCDINPSLPQCDKCTTNAELPECDPCKKDPASEACTPVPPVPTEGGTERPPPSGDGVRESSTTK